MGKRDTNDIMKVLGILGAIIGIILGIASLAGGGFGIYWAGLFGRIIRAIILIVLSLIVLLSCVKPSNPFPFNWIFILIMGIIILIFGNLIAGIIIIIAGIVGAL